MATVEMYVEDVELDEGKRSNKCHDHVFQTRVRRELHGDVDSWSGRATSDDGMGREGGD
jgi:hypothetical protein